LPNNEFGDFQTPLPLARQVMRTLGLSGRRGNWGRVLEPTCGVGNFLEAASELLPEAEVLGIEFQPGYASRARAVAPVLERSIFDLDLARDISWERHDAPLLVVGNPPWVTNAQLSVLGSTNRPIRANTRRLRGIDAMTGSSNFDIAEYIWLKLIAELMDQSPTISMLCKTQVARNVLAFCADHSWPVRSSRLHRIDARRWFGAAVDACLFTVDVGAGGRDYVCDVHASLASGAPTTRMGVVDGRLVADTAAYARTRRADGRCPLEWRQGVKHDASGVMEVEQDGSGPVTRSGVRVDVEEEFLFPLLKSTDVFRARTASLSKWMIVPQRRLSDDTRKLEATAPRLWRYLNENAGPLDGRRSAIYRNRPRFCVFGLGDYTFAPYKVAISGLHKSLEFRTVGPIAGRPAVFDDTCYFLSFADGLDCAVVGALLSSRPAKDLLASMVFTDAKRPVTKKVLQRIDLAALLDLVDGSELVAAVILECERLGVPHAPDEVAERASRLRETWNGGSGSREFVLAEPEGTPPAPGGTWSEETRYEKTPCPGC